MKKLLIRWLLLLMALLVMIPAGPHRSGGFFAYAQSDTTIRSSSEPYSTIRIPYNADMQEYDYFAFDPATGDIYQLNWLSKELTRHTEQGDSEVIALTGDEIPQNLIIDVRRNREKGEPDLYLWDTGVGRVFTVDLTTGVVTRVDKSFNHRNMFYHAAYVSENNEIHAMGGYGFWRFKNFLITYNQDSSEWLEESQSNNEIVYQGKDGSLFRTDTAFLYYVKNAYSADHAMFRMDLQTRIWERYALFDEFFQRKSESGFEKFSTLHQTSTYQIDQEEGAILFVFIESGLAKFLKINTKEKSLYEVDLLLFETHNVIALFYSQRIDKWVMIYRSSAISKEDNLYVKAISVDAEESYVKPLLPVASTSWTAWHYTLFSLGIVLFVTIGGVYWIRKRGGTTARDEEVDTQSPMDPLGISHSTSHPSHPSGSFHGDSGTLSHTTGSDLLILETDGTNIRATIRGNEVALFGFQNQQNLYEIICQIVENGSFEIPVAEFDEKMFPGDQKSLSSHKRKRLFEQLQQELGFDLFQEQRAAFDARIKILLLSRDRVKIVHKST